MSTQSRPSASPIALTTVSGRHCVGEGVYDARTECDGRSDSSQASQRRDAGNLTQPIRPTKRGPDTMRAVSKRPRYDSVPNTPCPDERGRKSSDEWKQELATFRQEREQRKEARKKARKQLPMEAEITASRRDPVRKSALLQALARSALCVPSLDVNAPCQDTPKTAGTSRRGELSQRVNGTRLHSSIELPDIQPPALPDSWPNKFASKENVVRKPPMKFKAPIKPVYNSFGEPLPNHANIGGVQHVAGVVYKPGVFPSRKAGEVRQPVTPASANRTSSSTRQTSTSSSTQLAMRSQQGSARRTPAIYRQPGQSRLTGTLTPSRASNPQANPLPGRRTPAMLRTQANSDSSSPSSGSSQSRPLPAPLPTAQDLRKLAHPTHFLGKIFCTNILRTPGVGHFQLVDKFIRAVRDVVNAEACPLCTFSSGDAEYIGHSRGEVCPMQQNDQVFRRFTGSMHFEPLIICFRCGLPFNYSGHEDGDPYGPCDASHMRLVIEYAAWLAHATEEGRQYVLRPLGLPDEVFTGPADFGVGVRVRGLGLGLGG